MLSWLPSNIALKEGGWCTRGSRWKMKRMRWQKYSLFPRWLSYPINCLQLRTELRRDLAYRISRSSDLFTSFAPKQISILELVLKNKQLFDLSSGFYTRSVDECSRDLHKHPSSLSPVANFGESDFNEVLSYQ